MLCKLKLVIIIIGLILSFPVLSSEDSGEYPFPEDFNFDDLPDIETPNKIEPTPANNEDNKSIEIPEKPVSEQMTASQNIDDNKNLDIGNDQIPSIMIAKPDSVQEPTRDDEKIFIPNVSQQENNENAFNKDKTLTEALKDNKDNSSKEQPLKGTWVEKITSSNPLSILSSDHDSESSKAENQLKELIKNARDGNKKGKSNAAVFDISGIMLRMNLQQTERTLQNRGFRKVNAKFQIPNFIKWRNEEACRNEGIVGYERLEACVITKAKKSGHEYLEYLKYAKFDSKEEIEIYFTSNFTENKVYKIVYNSKIANITGNSSKAIYIRNIKVYDFWKKINQKYGHPDNKTTVTWGLGGNKPYLKANTGYLLLEDPMFKEMDYTRMSREDQRFINSDFYNF